MCDKASCSKCYHLKCLTLSGMPRGRWDCPWHFCDVCGKRATQYCQLCPNSFCAAHSEGELFELSGGVMACDEHSDDEMVLSNSKADIMMAQDSLQSVEEETNNEEITLEATLEE